MNIFGKLLNIFAWKLVSRASNKFRKLGAIMATAGFRTILLFLFPCPEAGDRGQEGGPRQVGGGGQFH